ncbi:MAG: hypothetical protein DRQ14_02480 [Candidatus Latescibacterota bacterium]|nr:MAG: hypothetical protein DRQ14_02480 [Candidatus Latescibacterota bacterium]
MKFDAVFFDSGGTLFGPGSSLGSDPSPEEVDARRPERTAAMLKALGKEVALEDVRARLPECERLAKELYGEICTYVRTVELLYRSFGWEEKPEEVLCVTEAYVGPRYRSWLFPGTLETIAKLHEMGLVLGVIANTAVPGWIFDRIWKGVGLLDFFSTRVYSGEEGIAKPDPKIFQLAAQRAGVVGKRILYVGDVPEVDIVGAKSAGWSAALRRSQRAGTCELADFEFDDIRELVDYVCRG